MPRHARARGAGLPFRRVTRGARGTGRVCPAGTLRRWWGWALGHGPLSICFQKVFQMVWDTSPDHTRMCSQPWPFHIHQNTTD